MDLFTIAIAFDGKISHFEKDMVKSAYGDLYAVYQPRLVLLINNLKKGKLHAAADSVAWAMQSTRYQALQKGYTYELTISAANNTYQVLSKPIGASSFSNVGGAVPLTASPVTVSATTTLTFSPNGSVTVVAGAQTITLTYSGFTETVTVTNYGSVTVTP